jgi:hypothetical protein
MMATANQSKAIAQGTAQGLLDFLDYLIDKGYRTSSAIVPWKSAVRAIFSAVEGDDFGSFDVRSFDVDEYLDRFQNLVPGEYKQESLAAYRQRFKKAVAAYRDYLEDNTLPAFRARRARSESTRAPATAPARRKRSVAAAEPEAYAPRVAATTLMDYPFPLRSGQIAHLRLPVNLEKDDAERMATFIRSLVLEPQRQLPASPEELNDE